EAIENAIAGAVWNMRAGPKPPMGAPYDSGLQAVEVLARSYPEWPERFGDGLRPILKLFHVLIDRAGTGGALLRRFYAGFLAEATELLDDPALIPAARTYAELAEAWSELATTVRSGEPKIAHARSEERRVGKRGD